MFDKLKREGRMLKEKAIRDDLLIERDLLSDMQKHIMAEFVKRYHYAHKIDKIQPTNLSGHGFNSLYISNVVLG